MEKRLLVAFLISAAIVALWSLVFSPSRRPQVPEAVVAHETPATAEMPPGAEAESRPAPPEVVVDEAVAAQSEERLVLTNDVVEIGLSNRGAVVTSLILKDFSGDDGQALNLVQSLDEEWRALPLQLVTGETVDSRLYAVERIEGGYTFLWADGRGNGVRKELRLSADGYGLEFRLEARGELEDAWLSVGSGMRDTSEMERANRFSTWGDAAVLVGADLEKYRREKLKETVELAGEGVVYAGFSDTYFLSLVRPRNAVAGIRIVPREHAEVDAKGEAKKVKVLQILVAPKGGRLEAELLVCPKQYDLLHRLGGGVEKTLDFGFFHPISVFFLKTLQWTYGMVGNYGLAIVLLTFGIRLLLFPLMHKSTVSMRKMQKLQPKVKALQEKYRKNKSDPQVRAKMNQEMMELYRVEGVNPMGGCLPMLVQLPILWALYTLFAHAIELRHAPFVFWIHDLSARDPYYITPILMTATMWLQQKMAPQVGDPQQQRIFRLMPFIFGFMFLGFPSGLVLYWLTNNVITIVQQEVTFKLMGERRGKGGRE